MGIGIGTTKTPISRERENPLICSVLGRGEGVCIARLPLFFFFTGKRAFSPSPSALGVSRAASLSLSLSQQPPTLTRARRRRLRLLLVVSRSVLLAASRSRRSKHVNQARTGFFLPQIRPRHYWSHIVPAGHTCTWQS